MAEERKMEKSDALEYELSSSMPQHGLVKRFLESKSGEPRILDSMGAEAYLYRGFNILRLKSNGNLIVHLYDLSGIEFTDMIGEARAA